MTILCGKDSDPALITAEETLIYTDLRARIAACAAHFHAAGIRAGHRVGLYQPISAEYVIRLLALIELGAVGCPISTRLPESGVQRALAQLDAAAVLYTDRGVALGGAAIKTIEYKSGGETDDIVFGSLDDSRPATIIFTSGSSGTPKAAVHSLSNHLESALASNRNIALSPGDRWLLSLPLFHVGGLGVVFRCMQAGAAIVLPDAHEELVETIGKTKLTHVSLVSTQLYRLLQDEHATKALGAMRAVLMGGSAMPSQLIERALNAGMPIHTSYGMTEMTTQITCTPPSADMRTLQTSGRSIIEGNCRIGDDDQIFVTGPTLFQGYWADGGLSLPVDERGWFATGDCGRIDELGYLHVSGRMDNQFVSGGENIQPEEIEQALCQIDGIQQSVVVPISDEEFGQRPVAFIRTIGEWDEVSVKNTLRKTLPGFMIPARVLEWPRDLIPEGMKVDRTAMETFYLGTQR